MSREGDRVSEEQVRRELAEALAQCQMTLEEYRSYVAANRCGSCCPPDDISSWNAWSQVGTCLWLLGEETP